MLDFRMNRNRRGSIPVTVFVIVVLVLLMVAMASFAIKIFRDGGDIGEGFKLVQDYNLREKGLEFSGEGASAEPMRKIVKNYWLFGDEVMKVSVSKIVNAG